VADVRCGLRPEGRNWSHGTLFWDLVVDIPSYPFSAQLVVRTEILKIISNRLGGRRVGIDQRQDFRLNNLFLAPMGG